MLMNVISNRVEAGGFFPLLPCLDNLLAWNKLDKVEQIGDVWAISNKMPDPGNYIEVIGSYYGNFDGIVSAGVSGNLYSGNVGTLEIDCKPTSDILSVLCGSQDIVGGRYDFVLLRNVDGEIFFYIEGVAHATGYIFLMSDRHRIRGEYNAGQLCLIVDGTEVFSSTMADVQLNSGTLFLVGKDINGSRGFVGEVYYCSVNGLDTWEFIAGLGTVEYGTNANNLVITNPTFPDFWGKDTTGTIEPELAIKGGFLRSDGAYVPKGVDTSGMTGEEIKPFDWSKLPYLFRYPDVSAFQVWNKIDTLVWGSNFVGTPDADKFTWSYDDLLNVPQYLEDTYQTWLFVKIAMTGPVTELLTTLGQVPPCVDKTFKYVKDQVVRDENYYPNRDQNNDVILKD